MKTTGRFAVILGVIAAAFFAILLVSSAVHAQHTGTGMSLPSSGGGGGLTTATGDARYLKLDASNDPLTGALTIPAGSSAAPSLTLSGGPAQNGFWADGSYIYWGLGGSYAFAASATTAYVGKNLAAAGTVGVNSGLLKMANTGLIFTPSVQYARVESQYADNTALYTVTGGLQLYSAIDGAGESAVALGTSHATATATTKLLRIGTDVGSSTAMVSRFDFMGDGTLQAGAGAASTPTYSFLTDPNTGFYSAGADQVGVTVGGTNVGTFTSAGLTLPASTGTAAPFLNFSGTGTNSGVAYYDSGAQKVIYLRLNGSTVFSSSTTAYTLLSSYYVMPTAAWGIYGDGSIQALSTASSFRIYSDYAGANLNFIATNADGTGDTALAVGSRAVAGGQTTFAVCNDCDGTPSFLMKVQSDGDAQFGSGGIGDPSISFLTDPDTGFANASANELNVMAGGASIALFNANGLVLPSGSGVRVPSTSAASPSYTFSSASTTGIYNPSGTIVGIASGGAAVATFDSTGLTLAGSAALQTTLTGSGTLDFPSIGAGVCEDLTLTVTGVAVNTPVACSFPEALEGKLSPSCWVTAADTVKFRICNVNMASAVDPASGTFAVRSFQ